MYLWSNAACYDGGAHVLGNGEMLVYAEGPNITTVSGPPYSSLFYFSAFIADDTQTITALTERENGSGIWVHKLTYSDSPIISFKNTAAFMRFIDHIDCIRNVFVRQFKSIQSLTFKIIIPPYVKVKYCNNYRLSGKRYSCAFFTMAKNASPYLNNEQRLLCVLDGEIYFDTSRNEIHIKNGSGSIILASGILDKAVRNTVYVLKNYSRTLERTRGYYNKFLQHFHDMKYILRDEYIAKAVYGIESAAVFLKSMQMNDGGVIKSISKPVADISEQYFVIRAFLSLGCRSEAKNILAFMTEKFKSNCPESDETDCDMLSESSVSNCISAPAVYILSAAAYLRNSGDKNYIISILPILDRAIAYQIKKTTGNLMMTGCYDKVILSGFVTHRAAYYASARNTLLYIQSLKEAVYITETTGNNFIKTETVTKAYYRALAAFKDAFIQNSSFKSYAKCPVSTRQERFRFGICDMCGDLFYPRIITLLERSGDNYLCDYCYSSEEENCCDKVQEPKNEIVAADILISPYIGCDAVQYDLIYNYIKINEAEGYLPVICGSNKKYNADAAMLLYFLTSHNDEFKNDVFKFLVDSSKSNGLWSEYKTYGEYTTYTNAVCLEALIKYVNDFFNRED